MWRNQRLRYVGAGAVARICEPLLTKLAQRVMVCLGPPGLDDDLAIPVEAEPAQIALNAADELWPAAGLVEILDPQAPKPAAISRGGMPNDGAISMAEMEAAGGRGREAGYGHQRCCRKDS